MRLSIDHLDLELWVSKIETPGGYEWAVIQWGAGGNKNYEVSGQEKTYARAKINAFVKLLDCQSEFDI